MPRQLTHKKNHGRTAKQNRWEMQQRSPLGQRSTKATAAPTGAADTNCAGVSPHTWLGACPTGALSSRAVARGPSCCIPPHAARLCPTFLPHSGQYHSPTPFHAAAGLPGWDAQETPGKCSLKIRRAGRRGSGPDIRGSHEDGIFGWTRILIELFLVFLLGLQALVTQVPQITICQNEHIQGGGKSAISFALPKQDSVQQKSAEPMRALSAHGGSAERATATPRSAGAVLQSGTGTYRESSSQGGAGKLEVTAKNSC